MTHPSRAEIGLVKLGDSDFVPQNPEDDLRGKDVYDPEGQRIGDVKDLYIDHREREMRFLQVCAGDFLGMGEKPLLGPVEAVVKVAEDWLTIEPGRTHKVEGLAPFGTRVTPSGAGAPRREDRASLTYEAPEVSADRRREEAPDDGEGRSRRRVGGYGHHGRDHRARRAKAAPQAAQDARA